LMRLPRHVSALFPYTTLFRSLDGEIIKVGQIYLAPGGRHMRVARHGGDAVIALDDGPPVNFCKPAVDPLFTSAIDVWQGGILAVDRKSTRLNSSHGSISYAVF